MAASKAPAGGHRIESRWSFPSGANCWGLAGKKSTIMLHLPVRPPANNDFFSFPWRAVQFGWGLELLAVVGDRLLGRERIGRGSHGRDCGKQEG